MTRIKELKACPVPVKPNAYFRDKKEDNLHLEVQKHYTYKPKDM